MRFSFVFIILFIIASTTGCCPSDDDYLCTTPLTNNPNIAPQRDGGCLPGMKM